ncbi:MAG: SCO family protein [Myxococcota bacterium]|nr:SCO family protein [Myxococcota bacterium]
MSKKEKSGIACRRRWLSLLLILGCVGVLGPGQASADSRPPHRRFPEVELITHEGERVSLYEDLLRDKVVSINFIFTRCSDSCPAETAKLREVYERLGDRVGQDIFMYSISVDPEHDTPEALNAYAKKFQIGPGWLFLRASESDVELLEERFGLDLDEQSQDPSDHNISLVLGNERTGQWIKRSPFDNPNALAHILGYRLSDGRVARRNEGSYVSAPEAKRFSEGAFLFQTRCESCHDLGKRHALGPDLLGVTVRRDRAWLVRWIREPDKMLEEGDPLALNLYREYGELAMPNLRLEESEVESVIDYLAEEDRKRGLAPAPARQALLDESHGQEPHANSR